jgi:hypothetical protein
MKNLHAFIYSFLFVLMVFNITLYTEILSESVLADDPTPTPTETPTPLPLICPAFSCRAIGSYDINADPNNCPSPCSDPNCGFGNYNKYTYTSRDSLGKEITINCCDCLPPATIPIPKPANVVIGQ